MNTLPEIKYITGTPPTKETEFGRAWRCDVEVVSKRRHGQKHSTLCIWIVECKWAHPYWGNYALACVHLREVEGMPPAKKHGDEYTHEVLVAALHPAHTPELEDPGAHWLSPVNFAGQWTAADDAEACAKVEHCVDEILAGKLNPDTDFMHQWVERFSDSNLLTRQD